MKRFIIATLCLAGGLALAQEDDGKEAEGPIEEMQIRLTTMEEINVTARKTPVKSDGEVDSEIESILADAEAAEDED